ncbi:MAG: hypothetical protein V1748_08785 [Actinomycetota bacterium]
MSSRRLSALCILIIVTLLLPLTFAAGPALADMGTWIAFASHGFGDSNNSRVWAQAEYEGCLYAGTRNAITGCELWRLDGTGWDQVNADGFGADANDSIFSMVSHGGYLYAGVENAAGCGLFRTAAAGGPPYTDWVQVNTPGFGDGTNDSLDCLYVYGPYLYAGTFNFATGTEIWRTAGAGGPPYTDWVQVNTDGFGNNLTNDAWCMGVFESRLHVGVENGATGCEVWSTGAAGGPPYTDWVQVNADGFGAAANRSVRGLCVKGSYLYAAVDNSGGAGSVGSIWRTTAVGGPPYTDWEKVCIDGFGDTGNEGITSLITDGSYIYAGTRNPGTGTEIWRSASSGGPPFTDWTQVNADGFGAGADTMGTFSLIFFGSYLCGGTGDASGPAVGASVWGNLSIYPNWFLAEGSTAWGFDEYVSIENPNDEVVNCTVDYMTTGGPIAGPNVTLPAYSQATVDPEAALGNQDFSTKIACLEGLSIAVDRTMSWTGPGALSPEGHNSIGVTAPSTNWYLPEGSSEWGFETWLLIQNPNAGNATCRVTYMIEGAPAQTLEKVIPGNSRRTYGMETDIGARDASISVESDVPVIAERAMYRHDRREGHDSIGTTMPAYDYFLAEGTSAWGFTTYVLVQNPNPTDTEVTITYMTPDGPQPQAPFTMPAKSRETIRVNDQLPNTDLSTQVHGSQPIIAERAMYWDNGTGEACHDSIGTSAPHWAFMLPDGQADSTHETWTLVQNPGSEPVEISLVYFTPDGTGTTIVLDTVPANSRRTYNMIDKISGRAAVLVETNGPTGQITVERAMYWNDRGAGTDTIGGVEY